ncbi:glycosyltransferase family 2 protein [Methylocystis sp. JR02]|uniref:glycosyltransferase family 2 protein n=1 Tax=Methylocystis sp. JR02 TaxID=3046284 RepID=UPI0024BBAFCB|nr:glycosyltransferase family 2 protein [Methylocystis sp. JR02]MDJ0449485.1 glycosyltransferase family 2 protein [Methylocystis sp. JR02]
MFCRTQCDSKKFFAIILLCPGSAIASRPLKSSLAPLKTDLKPSAIPLRICRDVVLEDGFLNATSAEPWLGLPDVDPRSGGRFLSLRYAADPYDPPVRPVLRFWLKDGDYRDHILPAPYDGVGAWLGHTPRDFSSVWISPTNRKGRFDFEIIDIRKPHLLELLKRARHSPKRVFFAVSAGMVGLEQEAELNWRWALGSEPFSHYENWRRRREGTDSRRQLRCGQLAFSLYVDITGASVSAIDKTCTSIARQSYANWRTIFHGAPLDPMAERTLAAWLDKSDFEMMEGDEPHLSSDYLTALHAGDILAGNALESCAHHLERYPDHTIVYADELGQRPVLKPGWSPTLQAFAPYVGRSAFFASSIASSAGLTISDGAEAIFDNALSAQTAKVGSIRRPLFGLAPAGGKFRPAKAPDAIYGRQSACVGVVIPTRDRADLLQVCLESLFNRTSYSNYKVVVVDNDSRDPRTLDLMAQMEAAEPRLSILKQPGAFNFSALSNAGANAVEGDVLLFLNNDTCVMTPDWIERLLYFAIQKDIGAVGAKLLYPDQRVQHVGVLLGMGGVAGHFGAGLHAQAPGWMERNRVPHEVSAVTGACLMVERRKFEAVGGFDAVNLPIDLNDVDLCLRLGERGWRTICNAEAVLVHHQSASRGGGLRLQKVYAKERRFFMGRWRAVIRDDPYFHPALSLYAAEPALP